MARKNHGPSSPELRGKLQDSLSIDSIPEFFPTSNSKKGGGKNDFKGGNRGDAKKQFFQPLSITNGYKDTHNKFFSDLANEIWNDLLKNGIMII